MKHNQIPGTDMNVSSVALGTWVFGGDFWQGSDEAECLQTIDAAIDSGINFIDTAPIYGAGRSEEIIGKAIKNKRDQVYLATKCGLQVEGKRITEDLSAKSIFEEIDLSLKRLQVEYIDLYQCHWPDPKTDIKETIEALLKIKEQGKIRYIGLSNFGADLINQATQLTEIVTLQSQYSILDRELDADILPVCLEKNIGLLAYGVLAGGILTGKYSEPPTFKGPDARTFFYKYYDQSNFEKVQELLSKLREIDKPLSQIAFNWVRQHKASVSTLVGCRTTAQVLENVKAVEWDLTQEEIDNINALSLH